MVSLKHWINLFGLLKKTFSDNAGKIGFNGLY